MSTLVSQPAPSESWKQEINQRLAAHKQRKGNSQAEQTTPAAERSRVNARAAEAAARVAARYAKAPSYSEMQAAEARTALRAAEAATRAALEAQAAAQAALASLESAATEETEGAEVMTQAMTDATEHIASAAATLPAAESLQIRWEPDMRFRHADPEAATAVHTSPRQEASRDWSAAAGVANEEAQVIEAVEPAQPIHANLIEFPRELVATRRVRPRVGGLRNEATGDLFGQLSIFEVDPSTISTEPAAQPDAGELPPPAWSGPAWSLIELDDTLVEGAETEAEKAPALHLVPLNLRLLANAVDAALTVGIMAAAIAGAGHWMHRMPAMKTAELAGVALLLLTGVLYHAAFLVLGAATPGMRYARIALCTFDDEYPSKAQTRGRLGAMLLSLLPLGLGVVWSIFDEDHLCWHDRLSRTYLRKC